MSLGLGDLNKRRKGSTSKRQITSERVAAEPAQTKTAAPFTRPRTARPWTDTGLSRPNRRRTITDGAMSPEWLEAHSAPGLSYDFLSDHLLFKLQEGIDILEEVAHDAICGPLFKVQMMLKPAYRRHCREVIKVQLQEFLRKRVPLPL